LDILCVAGQGNQRKRVVEQSSGVSAGMTIVVRTRQYILEDMGTGERAPQVVDTETGELVLFAEKCDDHVNGLWYLA